MVMAVVSCVGDYMFTVDSQCGSVDVIFTDNETDSVRRRRVLHRRQLNDDKLRTAAVTDKDHPVPIPASCNEPADSSSTAHTAAPCASTTSATVHTCIAGSASTHTTAELSWTLSDAVSMTRPLDTDIVSSDNDNLSDEDTDILSAAYTKDAFHKYLIAG